LQTEAEFLKALAERPADRALRSVFCDWLLEQSDPRGEAMVLFDKGTLSPAERRRLEKLQEVHARKWLGPLADVAQVERCRFAGGLLSLLKLPANVASARYLALTGEVRLATVEHLAIRAGRVPSEVGGFLGHAVLRGVKRLEADMGTVLGAQGISFAPQRLDLTLWEPIDDLIALAACAPLQSATTLSLCTVEMFNPDFADELASALVTTGALELRSCVEAAPTFATFEGAARWLGRTLGKPRGQVKRWAIEYSETVLGLEGPLLDQLVIDIPVEGEQKVSARAGTAAAVMVQLGELGIRTVDIRHGVRGRLDYDSLNTLRAAARRGSAPLALTWDDPRPTNATFSTQPHRRFLQAGV
jgi:uncharacterized protein (TIGR02996 family)